MPQYYRLLRSGKQRLGSSNAADWRDPSTEIVHQVFWIKPSLSSPYVPVSPLLDGLCSTSSLVQGRQPIEMCQNVIPMLGCNKFSALVGWSGLRKKYEINIEWLTKPMAWNWVNRLLAGLHRFVCQVRRLNTEAVTCGYSKKQSILEDTRSIYKLTHILTQQRKTPQK